jgi:hypothetical protein
MTSDQPDPEEAVGTILGIKDGSVVVRLANGNDIRCRSAKRLHRPLGFLQVPIGRRARVRFHATKQERMPLIVEVLRDEQPG